jgi:hypothetical protein
VISGATPQPERPSLTSGSRFGPASSRRLVAVILAGSGLALVVVGSFLPWILSGQVRRSSYAIAGIVDRLGIAGDGILGTLVAGWPLVGLFCSLPVVAGLLRWWRTCGLLCAVLGLAAGTLAAGVLLVGGGRGTLGVRMDPIGPSVMAAGAVLLTVGGLAMAFDSNRVVR